MSRHLFPRAHLPHPHIADRLADVIAAAFHRQDPPTIVPDGHDWPEWRWDREGR